VIICSTPTIQNRSGYRSVEELKTHGRPMLSLAGRHLKGHCTLKLPPEYFDTERFTVEEAMDRFWGSALTQRRHPTTLQDTSADAALGSQDRVPPNLGVISSRKPLSNEIRLPLLEAHALFL
jgi:hypothetical protein